MQIWKRTLGIGLAGVAVVVSLGMFEGYRIQRNCARFKEEEIARLKASSGDLGFVPETCCYDRSEVMTNVIEGSALVFGAGLY